MLPWPKKGCIKYIGAELSWSQKRWTHLHVSGPAVSNMLCKTTNLQMSQTRLAFLLSSSTPALLLTCHSTSCINLHLISRCLAFYWFFELGFSSVNDLVKAETNTSLKVSSLLNQVITLASISCQIWLCTNLKVSTKALSPSSTSSMYLDSSKLRIFFQGEKTNCSLCAVVVESHQYIINLQSNLLEFRQKMKYVSFDELSPIIHQWVTSPTSTWMSTPSSPIPSRWDAALSMHLG